MDRFSSLYTSGMNIERVKYVIWAADMDRAVAFYRDLCGGRLLKQNSVIAEVEILGSVIGIHSGGEGKRTWTGLSFQVPDVIVGAREVVAAGGQVARLTRDGAEGGAQEGLRLFLDHRDQPVPHDLRANGGQGVFACVLAHRLRSRTM